ncbi:hypothetical protein [Lentzea sp. NBRC 102530]|uniref:hypothetical protein n=1 Tax=Lentzea sp. NBRC 102530 TaxID=3032201 RepID=UPI0024A29072|nr:hypothetical protein [Lentzea sp. NBRC 102530]GLY53759.1 hypothetical protein Lesp01_74150 [Lentzea sp. NBRC 102530]
MSLHFEVVYSLFLRDDTPRETLDELRYHLGLTEDRPQNLVVDHDHPVLAPDPDSYLPGGEHVALRRQGRGRNSDGEIHAWGLYARLYWVDDQWAEVWWQVAQWLAPYVADDGYIGFYREEQDERPTPFMVSGGELHMDDD